MKTIIIIFGLPASGKTSLAENLAQSLKAVHINSDRIRASLHLLGKYDDEAKQMIYKTMVDRMKDTVERHDSIILDATFHKNDYRRLILENIPVKDFKVFFIQTTADKKNTGKRLQVKRPLSEANKKVYEKLVHEFEPIEAEYLSIPSQLYTIDQMTAHAIKYINTFSDEWRTNQNAAKIPEAKQSA